MTNKAKFILVAGIFLLAAGAVARVVIAEDASVPSLPSNSAEAAASHRSFFMDKEFFDACYGRASASVAVSGETVAGTAPHHLLGCGLIAQWFNGVAERQQPSVVVIIGPNHNNIGNGAVVASEAVWQTPYGDLQPDSGVLSALEEMGMVSVDERVFVTEHSISGIVPFVRRSFPQAKVVPIILKDRLDRKSSEELGQLLNRVLPKDALVVASLDFSHYVSSAVAGQYDQASIPVLLASDADRMSDIHVDSKPTLFTLFAFNKSRGAAGQLVANSNAAKITGQPDLAEVTSYITVYYSQ